MNDKLETYGWACAQIRDAIDACMYGSITISMQNGLIGNIKTETVSKPPVDMKQAKS